jgi:2-methylcitrate dehydratase
MLCDMDIVLKNGQREAIRVEYHRGHPKNPMTDAEIEEKFRPLAGRVLAPAQVDALLKQLWALDTLPAMKPLFELTRIGK